MPLDQFNPGDNKRRAHKEIKFTYFHFLKVILIENQYASPLVHTLDYKWLKKGEHKDLPTLGKLTIR